MSDLLKDQNGGTSSKRVAGIGCIIIGCGLLLSAGVVSFFYKLPGVDTIIQIGTIFLGIGGGLLGIGVVEFFAPKTETEK